jgi:hypothetical protein
MDKKEFFDRYQISKAFVQSPDLDVISSDGFGAAIEEFINGKFGGIARVHREYYLSNPILACTEYTAFFLKTLLCDIHGRVFLNINISADERYLTILVSADKPLPLTDGEMRDLIRLARNAGMQIYPESCALRLTFSYADAALRRVYAINPKDARRLMLYKLGEIFHCGAISHTVKNKKEAVK